MWVEALLVLLVARPAAQAKSRVVLLYLEIEERRVRIYGYSTMLCGKCSQTCAV